MGCKWGLRPSQNLRPNRRPGQVWVNRLARPQCSYPQGNGGGVGGWRARAGGSDAGGGEGSSQRLGLGMRLNPHRVLTHVWFRVRVRVKARKNPHLGPLVVLTQPRCEEGSQRRQRRLLHDVESSGCTL